MSFTVPASGVLSAGLSVGALITSSLAIAEPASMNATASANVERSGLSIRGSSNGGVVGLRAGSYRGRAGVLPALHVGICSAHVTRPSGRARDLRGHRVYPRGRPLYSMADRTHGGGGACHGCAVPY